MYNVSTPAHGTSVYHENLTRIGKKNLQRTYPNGRTLGCDSETHLAQPLKRPTPIQGALLLLFIYVLSFWYLTT